MGILFSQINPFYPDVIVKKFPREYEPISVLKRASGLNKIQLRRLETKKHFTRWRSYLKYNSAEIGVDLHDDLPMLKQISSVPKEWDPLPRTQTEFHFCSSRTSHQYRFYERRIERKTSEFIKWWNDQEYYKTELFSCNCYSQGIYCNIPLVGIEFHNTDGKLTVEDGVRYVGSLVRFLLTNF